MARYIYGNLCDKNAQSFDLVKHIERQQSFSLKTFGPGNRTKGVIDHIRKELVEIENDPLDCEEWVDVILLALDGAWRAGHSSDKICKTIEYKQAKNETRDWPDWKIADADKAITHLKDDDGHYIVVDNIYQPTSERIKELNDTIKKSIKIDRNNITLLDDSKVTKDHKMIDPITGMQKDYVVLSEEERKKGFVRTLRHSYMHDKCKVVTTINSKIAETFAVDPTFYSGTFCIECQAHFPLDEFTWDGTNEKVI